MEKEVNWKANGKEPLTYKNAFIHVCNWTFFPLNYLELFRVIINPPMIRANNCEKNQSFPYKLDRILKISNIRIPIKIRLCDFSHISNSYPSLLLNFNVNQSKEEEEKKKKSQKSLQTTIPHLPTHLYYSFIRHSLNSFHIQILQFQW